MSRKQFSHQSHTQYLPRQWNPRIPKKFTPKVDNITGGCTIPHLSNFSTLSYKLHISLFNVIISFLFYIYNPECAPISLPLTLFPTLSCPWFPPNTPLKNVTSSLGAYLRISSNTSSFYIGSSTLPELDECLMILASSASLRVLSISTTSSSNQ